METISMGGWINAKVDDMNTATAADTCSEGPGNIAHYYKLYPTAPTAIILYACKTDIYEGKVIRYFLTATNMPHTHKIFTDKLTPYCKKRSDSSTNATLDARGYGAILPTMYIGGTLIIQWYNGSNYSQITAYVDEQIKMAKAGVEDSNLPKPTYTEDMATLGRGAQRFYNDAALWGPEIMQAFKDYGIITWEVSINPTFNGREDLVSSPRQFQHFLECLQTQYEQAIHEDKLKIVGIFAGEETKKYVTPYPFHKENSPDFHDIPYLTSSGQYNLVDKFEFDCMYYETTESTNPILYLHYKKEYFCCKWAGGSSGNYKSERVTDLTFIPDFKITYGRSPLAREYARSLTVTKDEEKHPLKYDSVEKYAEGVYVSIGGLRATLKPISIGGKNVSHTLDHSDQRIFIDIYTKRMKKYIHLQDWKEKSTFVHFTKPCDNPLIFAAHAMLCFQLKAFTKAERTEDRFISTLSAVAVGPSEASVKGMNTEARFGRIMEREFPDMEHVIGDSIIKRDILELPLNSQGNQAVDTLHCDETNGVWIATQVKTGKSDTENAFHDFVNTFRLLREKAREQGSRCHGILIHYNGLKNRKAYEILAKEIGISIVSRNAYETQDAFESRCIKRVQEIQSFY